MQLKAYTKKKQKKEWKELKVKKNEFQQIVSILNKFYSRNMEEPEKSESFLFREEFTKASEENIKIYFQKFGNYEFLVTAEILSEKGSKKETWIHIDGIQEEREELLRAGKQNHPIFQLTCVTDLYELSEKCEAPI